MATTDLTKQLIRDTLRVMPNLRGEDLAVQAKRWHAIPLDEGRAAIAEMNLRGCPACSAPGTITTTTAGVVRCRTCRALYTNGQAIRVADSWKLVKPLMASDSEDAPNLTYFDMHVQTSTGITRRHGWFDETTGLIHQVG